jgi:hypothetical protein
MDKWVFDYSIMIIHHRESFIFIINMEFQYDLGILALYFPILLDNNYLDIISRYFFLLLWW